jgi:hypothetical protein
VSIERDEQMGDSQHRSVTDSDEEERRRVPTKRKATLHDDDCVDFPERRKKETPRRIRSKENKRRRRAERRRSSLLIEPDQHQWTFNKKFSTPEVAIFHCDCGPTHHYSRRCDSMDACAGMGWINCRRGGLCAACRDENGISPLYEH